MTFLLFPERIATGCSSSATNRAAGNGTGELTGISGSMEIVIEGRDHFYKLDYVLP
ncbi:MAG TPA: DUF3224 domain-containing protein [Thermoanaerobaculia bacterium]|jgi:hypothetical protein|nr:DUF3224 domain-containing protein [Thermoanaerobaculia bacterium]